MSRSRRRFSFDALRFRPKAGEIGDEMREELEFHIEARTAQLIARGMPAADARAEAVRRLGESRDHIAAELTGSALLKARRLGMKEILENLSDDVGYALRGLARRPAFTAVAVLTLAIGIGANTAIFAAVDALLLRSLPFREPGRLMDIVLTNTEQPATEWSYPKFGVFRDAARSYSSLALHRATSVTLTGTDPERVRIEHVSAPYLGTLGVRVARGSDFTADLDAVPGAGFKAIISDALWQRRFGADPAIAGKPLHVNNVAYEIVGVLPPGFRGLSGAAEVLIPVTALDAEELKQTWSLEFSLIGRLRPGVTPAQATSEARLLGPRVYAAFPMGNGSLSSSKTTDWSADARPLDTIRVASALKRSLLVLFGAVGMVLLIACVNLATLLMGRASARRQEIAIRLAIGASRGRLVRLLLTESVTLALMGGALGVLVAWWGTRVLSAMNPAETLQAQGLSSALGAVGFDGIRLDANALLFTFAVTLGVGVLFGLVPALQATRRELTSELKDAKGDGRRAMNVGVSRQTLVVAEVALALVLLAGSGLMLRSLANLLGVNPGFDPGGVLTVRMTVPDGDVAPDSLPGFYERLQEAVGALPGVTSVALADCPPLNGGCNGTLMTFAGRPQSATGNAMVGVHWVTPSWFAAMRVPLKRGRMFGPDDRLGAPKVVLINETAARRYFAGEDPLGKVVNVYQGGFHTGATVIGIVGDVRFGTIDSTAVPDTYISYGQARLARMMIFVKTSGEPAALASNVRAAIHQLAPRMPVFDMKPMSARMAAATALTRFSSVLLALFAAVALSLAVMGIYGVMSFAVAQRTREIGIRMALGADRGRVQRLILLEGGRLVVAGVVLGVGSALALTRVLRSMLYEVGPADGVTYAAIVVILAAAGIVATWLPARSAATVDPMVALRRG